MDRGYFTIIGLLAIGIVYGILRKKRADKKSNSGWIGLVVLVGILLCFFLVGKFGDEKTGFLVGMAAMFVLPIMFFVAIGAGIASLFRKKKTKDKNSM